MYRMTVVVSDVGWVDTDFGSSLDGGTQLQLPSQIDGASHIMSTQPRSMTTMVTLLLVSTVACYGSKEWCPLTSAY